MTTYYVKPCWGVFRNGDRRTLSAYPSQDDAIRAAFHTNQLSEVEVVVLDHAGKMVEKWTRTKGVVHSTESAENSPVHEQTS